MDCVVCGSSADDGLRFEGVAVRRIGAPDDPGRRRWVWGPVPVHDRCRPRLTTPYDDQLGVPEAAVCGAEYLVATSAAPVVDTASGDQAAGGEPERERRQR